MALLKNVSENDRLRYEQEARDKFLSDLHWDRIYNFFYWTGLFVNRSCKF